MADFGSGLGSVIGGVMGHDDLQSGMNKVGDASSGFMTNTQPYNTFGQSFLDPATKAISGVSDAAGKTQGYDQFMAGYANTPAAKYQLQQADATQNNSAASRGGLLSGANNRALSTINNGIVSQNANNAYNEYLSGNQQQFGQLETALGNMFNAIGVGTTATGQQGGVIASQNSANASLAAAQAKNDQSKGSGIGSMFGGIGSFAAMF